MNGKSMNITIAFQHKISIIFHQFLWDKISKSMSMWRILIECVWDPPLTTDESAAVVEELEVTVQPRHKAALATPYQVVDTTLPTDAVPQHFTTTIRDDIATTVPPSEVEVHLYTNISDDIATTALPSEVEHLTTTINDDIATALPPSEVEHFTTTISDDIPTPLPPREVPQHSNSTISDDSATSLEPELVTVTDDGSDGVINTTTRVITDTDTTSTTVDGITTITTTVTTQQYQTTAIDTSGDDQEIASAIPGILCPLFRSF